MDLLLLAVLALLALCALVMLTQRPAPPVVVVVEPAPSGGIGCGPVILLGLALLIALALTS